MPESDMLIRPFSGRTPHATVMGGGVSPLPEVLCGRVTVIINDHTRPAVSRAPIEPVLPGGRKALLPGSISAASGAGLASPGGGTAQ